MNHDVDRWDLFCIGYGFTAGFFALEGSRLMGERFPLLTGIGIAFLATIFMMQLRG